MSKDFYLRVEKKLSEIEEEMKRIGSWEIQPPSPEAYEDMGAFGSKTMALEQWIRYVFIPQVHQMMASDSLPLFSSVGSYATRELDGKPQNATLINLLIEFDQVILKR